MDTALYKELLFDCCAVTSLPTKIYINRTLMAPMTRNLPPSEDPIIVHDSDSEPETVEKHIHKRRKTSLGKCFRYQTPD